MYHVSLFNNETTSVKLGCCLYTTGILQFIQCLYMYVHLSTLSTILIWREIIQEGEKIFFLCIYIVLGTTLDLVVETFKKFQKLKLIQQRKRKRIKFIGIFLNQRNSI